MLIKVLNNAKITLDFAGTSSMFILLAASTTLTLTLSQANLAYFPSSILV